MEVIDKDDDLEIILGIVAPLGTDRDSFLNKLQSNFEKRGYIVEKISLTQEFFDITCSPRSESFKYFIKMQICNNIRKEICKGFFAFFATYIIQLKRDRGKKVFIIDQIKNSVECDVLNHTYGLNYIQISLFSNEIERDKNLKNKFLKDKFSKEHSFESKIDPEKKYYKIFDDEFKNKIKELEDEINDDYEKEIISDVSHNLMKKDFKDFDRDKIYNKASQQVSKLFHKSHYYFNLDYPEEKIDYELKKFVKLICGEYREYPTQDEFGMNLAYQASVRSNFPGDRHIGAAIISEYGEVISVGSIRAPSDSANTTLYDQQLITHGYLSYKEKIEQWLSTLDSIQQSMQIDDIKNFINDSLEFHPCTHAEIAAIIDAAKIGISVRNCTLYTTTFPCHLCAKEIINAAIKRVVYLEAYPKSKNKELYPNIIDFDPKNKSSLVPFDFYCGIGPKRFVYAYSLKNKCDNPQLPPLIKFEKSKYYKLKEDDVIAYVTAKINKKGHKNQNFPSFLSDLFQDNMQQ